MNAVELYKKLPMQNCGKCRQKTCMPFAFALLRGEAELTECPSLTDSEIDELKGSICRSDWREDLILKLQKEVEKIDFYQFASGLGAEMKDGNLIVRSLGREFVITPDGEISTRGHITPWIKILLLHYVRTHGQAPISDKWVSYSELKSGMVKAASFRRECEEPMRDLFDRDLGAISEILRRIGAEEREGFATRNAWLLFLLPKVPVLILYWPEEDEFDSKVSVLFDSTADQFLDVESLIFLGEGLIKNIEAFLCRRDEVR
jgi:hypothetical protein